MTSVIELLDSHGPGLTMDFIELMVKNGATAEAARKRIERAKGQYKQFAGLRFSKNARFIYLDDQYGDDDFWKAMEQAFERAGTSYFHAVNNLRARGGRCRKAHFPIVAAAPLARKRHLSPSRILERLSDINLLEEVTLSDGRDYIQFKPNSFFKTPEALLYATALAELVAIEAICQWAKQMGWGSYNAFKTRNSESLPDVSGLTWDISAPSFMRPLRQATDGQLKPGFFVCDVNLAAPLGIGAVSAFIHKHDAASAPRKVAPIMPMLVGDVFRQDAYDLAKQKGIMAVTIATLFGADVRKALQDLIKLLSDAGNTASVNPEHMDRVLGTLSKIEGAAPNLRAALFEFVAGALLKDIESGFLVIGQTHTDPTTGRRFEIDVLLDQKDKARTIIIECKAKTPGSQVSLADVQRWYEDRVPLIFETLKHQKGYQTREFLFELWSNGALHPAASTWLTAQPKATQDYKIGWRDGKGLKEYAAKTKVPAILKTLNEHYFNHPLAKLKLSTQTAF